MSEEQTGEAATTCLASATGISGRVLSCALMEGHQSNLHVTEELITFMVIVRAPTGVDLPQPGPPLSVEQMGLCTRLWEIETALLTDQEEAPDGR